MNPIPISQYSDRQLLEMIYSRLLELESNFKDTLDIDEASRFSNWTPKTLYNKIGDGKIGAFKPDGGKLFIDREELRSHMRTNRILSMEEMKDKGANHLRTVNRKAS